MRHEINLIKITSALDLPENSDENDIVAAIQKIKAKDTRPEIREIAVAINHLTALVEQGGGAEGQTSAKPPELVKAISASGIKPGSKYKLDRDPEVKELVFAMILAGGSKYVEIADAVTKRFGADRSVSASSIQRYVRIMRRKHPEWR